MYVNFEAELVRIRRQKKDIAAMLRVSPDTFSKKLAQPNRMRLSEAKQIHQELFPSMDFLYIWEWKD